MPRELPGVFTALRHLVADDAPAHRSAHLGVRYRAACNGLCLPQPVGQFTWCRWPLCPACRTATAQSVVAPPTDVPRGHIDQPRMHAA